MKRVILNGLLISVIAVFSVWLYAFEEAAKPGALSRSHGFIADCETCHVPWRGAQEEMCLQCHFFDDPDILKPHLRFHEAEKHCLGCHFEHRGYAADIAEVDHTLFHPDLLCADCHFDTHDGKFGNDCRKCHGIATWVIEGFTHPPAENRNCHRCHAPPASHQEENFWERILGEHSVATPFPEPPEVEDCWQCHTTRHWGHMLMEHGL